MKTHLNKLLMVFSALLVFNIQVYSQGAKNPLPDSVFFKSLVEQYTTAVNLADTVLASKIWSPTAEISFISPSGNEYGWNGIKNIYKMFNQNFSSRKLSVYNMKSSYYGDVSWVTFFWTFDGTLKSDNSAVETKGRETQIWRKINYEWRLVHVHFSGMPLEGKS
jgi:ketosteroid isomerase-like protein